MQKSKSSDFSSNTDRLKEFAQRWSKLNPEEKQKYTDLLDRERQQYWRDVEEFKKVCMPRGLYLSCGVFPEMHFGEVNLQSVIGYWCWRAGIKGISSVSF